MTLTETVAAIARRTGDATLAQQAIRQIEFFPGITLVALTQARARRAARFAAVHRLRGAGAVYVAVAAERGATLITWDAEMRQRGAGAVPVRTPAEWLANPPATP